MKNIVGFCLSGEFLKVVYVGPLTLFKGRISCGPTLFWVFNGLNCCSDLLFTLCVFLAIDDELELFLFMLRLFSPKELLFLPRTLKVLLELLGAND